MPDIAINVQSLGKSYLVGHDTERRDRYASARDALARSARGLLRKTRDMLAGRPIVQGDVVEEFWALKDISFEVKAGDRVGIIGRNGAGKSTLLKILSRITEPTQGRVEIKGRVASLLEVGTGFHPELSGRENIFLNGAILGMTRREIQGKFDEIVDFAGVERFLDTPVKRYSSGMYVRLAFAVSAHLEPEILIVDEVLAVGDSEFQQKCLGKMRETGAGGRTVLFVSHNMGAISELCNRAILLKDGGKEFEGDTDHVIDRYLAGASKAGAHETFRSSCGRFELHRPYWVNERGEATAGFRFGEDCALRFDFLFHEGVGRVNPGIAVRDMSGRLIFVSHLVDDASFNQGGGKLLGKVAIETRFALPSLAPGLYGVAFGVRDEADKTAIYAENELFLEITAHGPKKNGAGGVLWHTTAWRVAR